jgi:preprotein translocase subunit SecG
MGVFITIAIIIFVPVCVVLTLIILLQDSKGEGLSSSAFGGSGMESVLGGAGAATFLSKLTTWVAIGFMVISLLLMRFYGDTGGGDGTLTPLNEETEKSQESAGTENGVEVEEEAAEDSKVNVTPTEEQADETPAEKPEEDSKITPIENTE